MTLSNLVVPFLTSSLIIMGMMDELAECRKWLETLDFKKNYDTSTFETIIR